MVDRVVAFLITTRWWLFIVGVAISFAAWGPSRDLAFDRRIEQMFPASDPSVDAYDLLRRRFGGNAVVMLVYHDVELMSEAGLRRVSELANRAAAVPGVKGVLSLAQVNDALERAEPGRLLGIEGPSPILGSGALARGFRDLFAGYTHDSSGEYAAIVAMLDPAHPDAHAGAIASLRGLADDLPPNNRPLALVGEPVLVSEGFTLVEEDGRRLATTTLWLLGIVTLLMFRSLRWVIAELILIAWAVVLTRGAAAILGMRLTMVSSMLTAIVTVIAVGCVIHLAVQYGMRRRRGDTAIEAARRTFVGVLPPIMWACLTDAAGFAALAVSEVGPVRDFGLMMTLGSGMVLAGVLLLMPALVLMPPHSFASRTIPGDRWIRRRMVRMVVMLDHHRRVVGIVTLILAILTAVGLTRLRTETNFIRNFRSSSQLARSYAMVESELGGAGVWDILLPAPDPVTTEYLASVRDLERSLRAIRTEEGRGLTKVLSIADADATAAQAPLLGIATPGVRIAAMRAAMPTFVDALITPPSDEGPAYLRIMLRSSERIQATAKMELIAEVTEVVDRHTSSPQWLALLGDRAAGEDVSGEERGSGRVTGYYVLLARLIESLLRDQWLCLSVAAGAVFLMMAVALRSLRLAAVCMVPNLLPVLAVLGMLGLSGMKVNMGAAMIAAVSIGLTIDGSIHFMAHCLGARDRGAARRRAVLYAQSRVGLPVLLATIALALGFSVLATSAFIPTVTFGLLVTAALAAGTLANLTLLPLLLVEMLPSTSRGD